jgi:hypothetical protein
MCVFVCVCVRACVCVRVCVCVCVCARAFNIDKCTITTCRNALSMGTKILLTSVSDNFNVQLKRTRTDKSDVPLTNLKTSTLRNSVLILSFQVLFSKKLSLTSVEPKKLSLPFPDVCRI